MPTIVSDTLAPLLVNERYRLLEIIGKGANAVVYKAEDTAAPEQRVVAVKKLLVLHKGSRSGPDSDVARFRREADLLKSLDHPNIVKYLDDFADDEAMYIVMEFATQGSLLSLIRRVPMLEETAAQYLHQVVCGLSYLHRRRVMHRDIKAANVLLGDNGVAKLTDFGLASPMEATSQNKEALTMLVGSVYWMSPESIARGTQSEAGDVWSLGCTAIELVTGVPPFFDRAPVNALYHIAESTESPVPMNVSEWLRSFLTACLQRDPAQRPHAAELMQHDWFRQCGVTIAPTAEPARKEAADSTALNGLESTSSIAHEVESYLFGERSGQREEWLENGGLARAVDGLTTITAEDSYRIVRSLAFESQRAAASDSALYFTALGETNFWSLDLSVLATMDNVATLFCDCCSYQPPTALHYAPAHHQALHLVLRSADVGPQCITALHQLLVARAAADAHVPSTAALRESKRIAPTVVSSAAARTRFAQDGGAAVLRNILQEMCLQAFRDKAEPHVKWEYLDRLFDVLLSLDVADEDGGELPPIGDNWLIAVQEACIHHCRYALRLLVHSIRGEGRIQSGERVVVGRLISVASDPLLDYDTRLMVAACFPALQREYPDAAAALCDVHGNIPLLTHMMRHVPPTGAPDAMLKVLVSLCEDQQMAAACASYDGMLSLTAQKIAEARQRNSPECLDQSLKLAELLFLCAPHPEWFVTSRELTRQLVDILATRAKIHPVWSVAQCLTHESAVSRAERLLDALAAQSLTV